MHIEHDVDFGAFLLLGNMSFEVIVGSLVGIAVEENFCEGMAVLLVFVVESEHDASGMIDRHIGLVNDDRMPRTCAPYVALWTISV